MMTIASGVVFSGSARYDCRHRVCWHRQHRFAALTDKLRNDDAELFAGGHRSSLINEPIEPNYACWTAFVVVLLLDALILGRWQTRQESRMLTA